MIGSNTSSIPIAELAQAVRRPGRLLGLHFFSPVPVMKLVEVVVALDTDASTVDRAKAFAEELGNTRSRRRTGQASSSTCCSSPT